MPTQTTPKKKEYAWPFDIIRKACGRKRPKHGLRRANNGPSPLVLISEAIDDSPLVLVGEETFDAPKSPQSGSPLDGKPSDSETTPICIVQKNASGATTDDDASRLESLMDTIGNDTASLRIRNTLTTSDDDDETALKTQISQYSVYSSESDWETSDMEIIRRAFCSASPRDIIQIMNENYSSLSDGLQQHIQLDAQRIPQHEDLLRDCHTCHDDCCPLSNSADLQPRRLADEFNVQSVTTTSSTSWTLPVTISTSACDGQDKTSTAQITEEDAGFEAELVVPIEL